MACLGSGCGLESHMLVDPLPLVLFCDGFFDAMCEPLESCGCGELAGALCRQEQRELCAGFPSASMRESVEGGRLRYDGRAAAALFERMRARSVECASFVDAIDWRVRDLFTVGGVFEGSVPAGERCSVLGFELISECALGSCALIDGAYLCRAVVGAGAACDATHQCADLDAELRIDLGIDRLSLRCDASVCERRVADGLECASDAECESGLCADMRCLSRVEGEACASSRECESGYCSAERRCGAGDAPDSAPCDDHAACASHVCILGTCFPAGCGTF